MARQGNSFALLDDEEGDDVSTLLERVAAKVDVSLPPVEKKQKKQSQSSTADAANLPLKPLTPSDNVRGERGRGRGRGGRGRASGRFGSGGNEVEQFGNGSANDYQQNYGGADGYQRNYRGGDGYQGQGNYGGADGYQRNYGEVNGNQSNYGEGNGYHGNYGGADGYKSSYGGVDGNQWNYGGDSAPNAGDDNRRGRGRGRGGGRGRGRGRGRGFDENNGFGNESEHVVNQQLENQGQDSGDGSGWEQVNEVQGKVLGSEGQSFRDDERPFRNGNRGSGGDRRGYGGGNRDFRGREGRSYGGRDGRNGKAEVSNDYETREVLGDEKGHAVNGDNNSGGAERDAPVTTEVAEDAEPKQGKLEAQDNSEQKVPEEEDNEMTLEEYEKLCFEKRKVLETLKKTEERKVTLDKDFESMQLVEKKKEDSLFIKLKAEKDKLKKKDSLDKEEKVRKSLSINEFLKPAEGEIPTVARGRSGGQGRGRGGRGRGRGGQGRGFRGVYSGGQWLEEATPALEDPGQFPVLGGAVKA